MNRRQAREQAFIIIFQYEFHSDTQAKSPENHADEENFSTAESTAENFPYDFVINEIFGNFLATHENVGEQEIYVRRICEQFISGKEKIDELIEKYSQNWKKDRISMVSLATLRLAICEILHFDDIPTAVSISEALEVAKKFEGEEAIPFINGILDGVRAELDSFATEVTP